MGELLLTCKKFCLKEVRTVKLNSEGLGKGRIKAALCSFNLEYECDTVLKSWSQAATLFCTHGLQDQVFIFICIIQHEVPVLRGHPNFALNTGLLMSSKLSYRASQQSISKYLKH